MSVSPVPNSDLEELRHFKTDRLDMRGTSANDLQNAMRRGDSRQESMARSAGGGGNTANTVAARISRLQHMLDLELQDEEHDDDNDDDDSARLLTIDANDDPGKECLLSKLLAVALILLLVGFIYVVLVQEYLVRSIHR